MKPDLWVPVEIQIGPLPMKFMLTQDRAAQLHQAIERWLDTEEWHVYGKQPTLPA